MVSELNIKFNFRVTWIEVNSKTARRTSASKTAVNSDQMTTLYPQTEKVDPQRNVVALPTVNKRQKRSNALVICIARKMPINRIFVINNTLWTEKSKFAKFAREILSAARQNWPSCACPAFDRCAYLMQCRVCAESNPIILISKKECNHQ